jgi:hypothetical protein
MDKCDKCKNQISGICKECGRNTSLLETKSITLPLYIHTKNLCMMWEEVASGEHPTLGKFIVGREALTREIWVEIADKKYCVHLKDIVTAITNGVEQ